jgi:hypothetical protein
MQIQGSHVFPAPRKEVWDALLDPTVLSLALPGGEQLERINDYEYKAAMNVRVGPVQGKFDGKVELSDIQYLESYIMKVSGQGAPGFLTGEGSVRLVDVEGGTVLNYLGDAQVGGRIAGVGQRLIESTAKSIIRQGLTALDGQIATRRQVQLAGQAAEQIAPSPVTPPLEAAPAVTSSTLAASTAPAVSVVQSIAQPVAVERSTPTGATTTAKPDMAKIAMTVAKDVSRDLISEVIPLKNQEKALWFVLGALSMLLFVILVRLVA